LLRTNAGRCAIQPASAVSSLALWLGGRVLPCAPEQHGGPASPHHCYLARHCPTTAAAHGSDILHYTFIAIPVYLTDVYLGYGKPQHSQFTQKAMLKGFNMFSSKSVRTCAFLAALAGCHARGVAQEPTLPAVVASVETKESVPAGTEPTDQAAEAPGQPAEAETTLTPYERLVERLDAAENRIRELEEDDLDAAPLPPPAPTSGHLLKSMVPSILLVHDPEVAIAREQIEAAAERYSLQAEEPDAPGKPRTTKIADKKWYEKLSLRGYSQFRLNETTFHERGTAAPQTPNDGSVGRDKNFLIRRARVIIQGQISDHVAVYLQNDFAANVGQADINQFTQIRDWYADVFLDKTQIHRLRVGQSKVPYGWENLQSSSNRINMDRNDAFNTAVKNERDLGVFYYWTPVYAQKLFRYVLAENLKGSGNYGVFGFGVYNGQGGSFAEQNDNAHIAARFTWPFTLENGQIIELSMQGYTGKYVVFSSAIRPLGEGGAFQPGNTIDGTIAAERNRGGIRDERVGWSAIVYPQPIGFQAEWTVGSGPGLDPEQRRVEERALYGGYLMALAKIDTSFCGLFYPFVRWQYYKGGFKAERNAPFGVVNEYEAGVEWQITPAMEFTMQYTITDRMNTTAVNRADFQSYDPFIGQLLRMQFQVNY